MDTSLLCCRADLFRERTAGVAPGAALETPQQLRGLPAGPRVEAGDIPTLKQLGLTPPPAVSSDSKPTGGVCGSSLEFKCAMRIRRQVGPLCDDGS